MNIIAELRDIATIRPGQCNLSRVATAAADEIERLQATVDKWPKTRDGVSATPGMAVYSPLWQPVGFVESLTVRVPSHTRFSPLKDWYSTREAAEAAKGEGK